MAGCGCNTTTAPTQKISPKFRKALWIALVLNAAMFFVEMIGGSHARSVSLWADALDFAGDAANYTISLAVLSMTLYWRATAALLKGITMTAFGVFVIAKVIWSWWLGLTPEPMLMGAIGVLALIVMSAWHCCFMLSVMVIQTCVRCGYAVVMMRLQILQLLLLPLECLVLEPCSLIYWLLLLLLIWVFLQV